MPAKTMNTTTDSESCPVSLIKKARHHAITPKMIPPKMAVMALIRALQGSPRPLNQSAPQRTLPIKRQNQVKNSGVRPVVRMYRNAPTSIVLGQMKHVMAKPSMIAEHAHSIARSLR